MSSPKTFMMLNRKEVVASLKAKGLKTGDIIVRLSDTKGPFGIPFSAWVAKLSKSRWSHASVLYMKGETPYVLEVSDRGVVEYRLLDWLDFCVDGDFAVYRYKDMTPELTAKIEEIIQWYLDEDPLYDFSYADKDKVYCVESVCEVFLKAGIQLCDPRPLSDMLTGWKYYVFVALNTLAKKFTGKGFETNAPVYFVGNDKVGLISSDKLECIVEQNPLTPVY